jgi:hypothetical protein
MVGLLFGSDPEGRDPEPSTPDSPRRPVRIGGERRALASAYACFMVCALAVLGGLLLIMLG